MRQTSKTSRTPAVLPVQILRRCIPKTLNSVVRALVPGPPQVVCGLRQGREHFEQGTVAGKRGREGLLP